MFSKPLLARRLRSIQSFCLSSLFLLACILVPQAGFGQTTGTVSGTVQDSSGAVIPNAQVTLVNEQTHDKRMSTSNGEGFFTFAGVSPSSYTIDIAAPNFKSFEQKGIALNPGDIRVLNDLDLQPGSAAETVEVESAQGALLPQDSGERSSLLTTKDISRLAIEGREISELLKILPGVTSTANGIGNGLGFSFTNQGAAGSAVGVGLSTNGAPYRGGTAYLLDGANIIDPGCNCWSVATVNPDMTAEVKVQASNFGADSPNGPVVVNAISKSGSAEFHGQGYLYARNGVLNSNTYSNNQTGVARPDESYYYPGGNIGGPVKIKGLHLPTDGKLFFWAGFEDFRQNLNATPLTSYVPTDAMRAGNFNASAAGNAALCPTGFNPTATTYCNNLAGTVAPDGTTITGSQIPAQYLDPGALSLLKLFPEPNATPTAGNGYSNYYLPTVSPHNGYIYRGRLDYNLSEATKIFATYQFGTDTASTYAHQYYTPANAVAYPGGLLVNTENSHVLTGNLLHVFSASMTNDFVAAYAWFDNPTKPSDISNIYSSTIGYPYSGVFNTGSLLAPALASPGTQTLPDISQADVFQQGGAYVLTKQSPSFYDDFTAVYRSHTFKAGIFTERSVNSQGAASAVNGQFSFGSGLLADQLTGIKIGSLNPLANFLMGISSSYTQASVNPAEPLSFRTVAFYGMDTYKVTSRVTLNLGIRFDHIGHWTNGQSQGLAVWEPSRYAADITAGKQYPGVYWHGIDSTISKTGADAKTLWYSPRLGVAWDAKGNGTTVVRGGWGMYRWNDQYNDYAGPLSTALGVRTYNSTNGNAITFADVNALGKSNTSLGSLPSSVYAVDPTDNKLPITYAYNMTVSQQLPGRMLFEIAYVGNHTNDLLLGGESGGGSAIASDFINKNKIPLGGLFRPDPVTGAAAPADPENLSTTENINDYYALGAGYGTNSVSVPEHGGYANYNGLQLSLAKQAGRLSFNVNYTWSKSLGITNNSVDAFNLNGNYGVLAIDRPNVINTSYTYDLGHLYGGNRFAAGAVNGWTVSGITTWQEGGNLQALYTQNLGLTITDLSINPQTGQPKDETLTGRTYFGTPSQTILPTDTCNPTANLASRQHVNLDCLTAPVVGQQGIRQLPYLVGPAYFNSDLALYKTFSITEHQSIQFRASAFNFLNHPLDSYSGNTQLQLKVATTDRANFTQNVSNPTTWGFTDTKEGQRVLQLALKYAF